MQTNASDIIHIEDVVYARDSETDKELTVPMKTLNGSVICFNCEGRAKWGWVYRFGAITLVTCNKSACQPSPPWFKGWQFGR